MRVVVSTFLTVFTTLALFEATSASKQGSASTPWKRLHSHQQIAGSSSIEGSGVTAHVDGTNTGTDVQQITGREFELQKRYGGARFSFYDAGLGACGKYNTGQDFIVALNSAQFDTGKHCFKQITISVGGKSTPATIVDRCPGCPYGGLDMSRGLFQFFAPESVGIIHGEWNFGGEGGGPPPPPPFIKIHRPKKPAPPPPPSVPPVPSPSVAVDLAPTSTLTPTSTAVTNATEVHAQYGPTGSGSQPASGPVPTEKVKKYKGNVRSMSLALAQVGSMLVAASK